MSTFGSNSYGQNVYGAPVVWCDSVSEVVSAADSVSGSIVFVADVDEYGAATEVVSSAVESPL
jgi:hypothetical protein